MGGDAVREHPFDLALPLGDLADLAAGRGRHPLVGAGLEELAHPHAAGVARRAAGRQDVVRADRLVAVGDGRLLADEERAVVGQAVEVVVLVRARAAPGARARSRR